MDLFVLDRNLVTVAIIDSYTSLIWTDRYQEAGDFELCLSMSSDLLNHIKQDYYLFRRDSEHVMIIEKLLIKSDAESGNTLTVSGRSLESILDRRVVWGLKNLNGNLQNGVKELLDECIISPLKPERKIDNFVFVESSDPQITELKIETQYTGDNLYDVIKNLCSERGIGFKITFDNQNRFAFQLYAGSDRSYDQFTNPYVVFSPKFDNIINSNYMESRSSWKNVTLVGGEGEGTERRYTAVGNTSGLDRRELFTDARDISSDDDTDLTEEFDFAEYPSEVFNNTAKAFVTDSNFNSAKVDVSRYVGRKISITIPKYADSNGAAVPYATILVDESKKYISTLKVWEKEGDDASTKNRGSLETYEFVLPSDAKYIYTTMYSQKAIDSDIYYGSQDAFECRTIMVSNDEYIALLRQRGKEDLAENIEVVSAEGEADTMTMFKYGKDFFAGDIVQVSDDYGHEMRARVLEVVMSDNEDGSSTTYPTFSTFDYVRPEPNLLPEGYQKLDYIESSGTQYIDTEFKANQDTRVILDAYFLSQKSYPVAIFGARTSSVTTNGSYTVWAFDSERFRTDYGDAKSNIFVVPSGRHTIDKHKNVTYVDEVLNTNPKSTFSTPYNLAIFSQKDEKGADTRMVSMRLYSCKVYDNGVLVRNFIPCINTDQLIGLYDSVTARFYSNTGSGAFIAGVEGA